jgi:flagellar hook-associated protein 2
MRLLRVHAAVRVLGERSAGDSTSGIVASSSRRGAVQVAGIEGGSRSRSATFVISVSRLASAQVNEGIALSRDDTNSLQAGMSSFAVVVGGGPARTVSFTNDTTDTHGEALERLATAINEASAGVTATVVEDEPASTVRLDVRASSTGIQRAFSLSDVTGNVIAATGIGTATTTATDAAFIIDGVPGSTSSNSVLIDEGRVRLMLTSETGPGTVDDPGVVVSVRPDPTSGAVVELAQSINSARAFLDTEGSLSSLQIRRAIDGLLRDRQTDLGAIGLRVDAGGRLGVDAAVLESVVEANPRSIDALFGRSDGIGAQLTAITERALGAALVERLHGALRGTGGIGRRGLIPGAPGGRHGLLLDLFG